MHIFIVFFRHLVFLFNYHPFIISLCFPRINFIDDKQVVSNSETLKLVQELDSNKDSSLEIQGWYFQKSFRRMINI